MRILGLGLLAVSASVTLCACLDQPLNDDPPNLNSADEALYGSISYHASCSAEHQAVLNESARIGRATVATAAFEQCLDQRMTARYKQCKGDSFYDEKATSATSLQKQKLLEITRNLADLSMRCDGTLGNASTTPDKYEHVGAEDMSWAGWLRDNVPTLGLPVCSASSPKPCRYAPYPWPYSQAAGILWHEAMHQRGYLHGADEQPAAKTNCGYASLTDAQWHFMANTAPYIVEQCVKEVIDQSVVCSGMATACPGGYNLVASFGGTDCECVHDPRDRGLSFVSSRGGKLDEYAKIPDGAWVDGSYFDDRELYQSVSDDFGASRSHGDLDGDGRDDLLMTDASSLSLVVYSDRPRLLGRTAWGTRISGGWQLRKEDRIVAVADIDGNGRAEIVIKSASQGLGIFGVSPLSGMLISLHVVANGARIGRWTVGGGDLVIGTADFDGDRRADLVVRSAWGLGILGRTAAGVLTHKAMHQYTQPIDRWHLIATDQVVGMGDLNADGRAELLLWDMRNLGVFRLPVGGSALTSLSQPSIGTPLGDWRLGSGDVIRGVAPIDGDLGADILITSAWGWGVLRWSARENRLTSVDLVPYGTLLPGDWRLGPDTVIERIGDIYRNGQAEIVVTNPSGLGVLSFPFFRQKFEATNVYPYGSFVSSLLLSADSQVVAIGDYNGDGSEDLLVER